MTFNYKIVPTRTELTDSSNKIDGFQKRKKTFFRKLKRDRRKHDGDRRSSVRDGVIVSLSSKPDRRKGTDRRKLQTKL